MAQKQISEHLIFDDISRELTSQRLEGKQVALGLAAAYCLDYLIEANGEVVSQETLIDEGWRKQGFEVSPDNVRKVISQLRSAFRELEEPSEFLVTVPKLGYRLQVFSQIQNDRQLLSHVDTVQILDSGEITPSSGEITPSSNVITPSSSAITSFLRSNRYSTRVYLWGGILLLNLVLAISYFYMTRVPALAQAHYQYFSVSASSIKDKQLFVDTRMLNKPDFINRSLMLLTTSPFWKKDRIHYGWLYLNVVVDSKVHSFFLCDKPITEKKLKCTSRVFVEE